MANPKRIDLCRFADLWLQQRAGTDVALLMGIMRVIVDEGLVDDRLRRRSAPRTSRRSGSRWQDFDPETVEPITGVPKDKIGEAARIYATSSPGSILYAMGITQHTTAPTTSWPSATWRCSPATWASRRRGQSPEGPEQRPGRLRHGRLPDVYPGYQKVANPAVQEKFEQAWGVALQRQARADAHRDVRRGAARQGEGDLPGGREPVLTDADATHVRKALEEIDFLVVQDIFLTETAQLADVVLPAASFAEKDGTFTNTERRVQRVRKAVEPAGDARPDWWIVGQVAKRMGAAGFDFEGPEQIMEELASLTPSYGGITYERLDDGGLQWPVPDGRPPGDASTAYHQVRDGRWEGSLPAAAVPGVG